MQSLSEAMRGKQRKVKFMADDTQPYEELPDLEARAIFIFGRRAQPPNIDVQQDYMSTSSPYSFHSHSGLPVFISSLAQAS